MEERLSTDMKDMTFSTPERGSMVSDKVMSRLKIAGIHPNEALGQHFLMDDNAVDLLAQAVSPSNIVIEIGSGVGQLTDALAERANKVISIEIDRRYEPILDEVIQEHPNVQIIYGDALATRFEDFFPKRKKDMKDQEGVQIIASLPYHITEPFLHKLIGIPLESVTLVVGQRLSRAIQAKSENDPDFGQLTLLAQTFFEIEVLAELEKQKFFPIPRTDSTIIRLIPKEKEEFRSNRRNFLLRRLFTTAKRSPLVKNALKESLIEFSHVSQIGTRSKREHNKRVRNSAKIQLRQAVDEYNHTGSLEPKPERHNGNSILLTQNQAWTIIGEMGISQETLDKPFEQLNNNELKALSRALREDLS